MKKPFGFILLLFCLAMIVACSVDTATVPPQSTASSEKSRTSPEPLAPSPITKPVPTRTPETIRIEGYMCPGETIRISAQRLRSQLRFLSADGQLLGEIPSGEGTPVESPPLYPDMSPFRVESYEDNQWTLVGIYALDFVSEGEELVLERVEISGPIFPSLSHEIREGEPGSDWGHWGECLRSHEEEHCGEPQLRCVSPCETVDENGEPVQATVCCSYERDCFTYTVCDEQEWVPEQYDRYPINMTVESINWVTTNLRSIADSEILLTEVTNHTNIDGVAVVSSGDPNYQGAAVARGESDPINIPISMLKAWVVAPILTFECGYVDVPHDTHPNPFPTVPCKLPDSVETRLSFKMSCTGAR